MTDVVFASGNTYTVVVSSSTGTIVEPAATEYTVVQTFQGLPGANGINGSGVPDNGIVGQVLVSNGGVNSYWSNSNVIAANSATYLNGNTASNLNTYADNKAANAYSNATSYVDGKSYVNTSQLSSNLSNYQTTAGLSANVATLAANSATYILANNGIISNSSGVFVRSGNNVVVNSTGVHVTGSNANTGNIKFANSLIYGNNSSETINLLANSNGLNIRSSDSFVQLQFNSNTEADASYGPNSSWMWLDQGGYFLENYNDTTLASAIYVYKSGTISLVSNSNYFTIENNVLTLPGDISGNTAGFAIGYRDIPQNFTNTSFTLALTDAGKHILTQNSGSSTQTITVPNNSSVAFSTGAAITVIVQSTGTVAVANGAGVTMYLAGNSTAKSTITLNSYSMATVMKIGTNIWIVSGTGAV